MPIDQRCLPDQTHRYLIRFFLKILRRFIWSFKLYIVKLNKRPTILLGPHTARAHALRLRVLTFLIKYDQFKQWRHVTLNPRLKTDVALCLWICLWICRIFNFTYWQFSWCYNIAKAMTRKMHCFSDQSGYGNPQGRIYKIWINI